MTTELSLGHFEGLKLNVRAASIQVIDGKKFLVWHCEGDKQLWIPLGCGALLITPKDGKIEIVGDGTPRDSSCYPYEQPKVLCQRSADPQGV